jgi:hypothetical protein
VVIDQVVVIFCIPFLYFIIINCLDCNKKQEWVQQKIDSINQEEKAIQERHIVLKKDLYAKFGNSINLET